MSSKMASLSLVSVSLEILSFILMAIVMAIIFVAIGFGVKLGIDLAPKFESGLSSLKNKIF